MSGSGGVYARGLCRTCEKCLFRVLFFRLTSEMAEEMGLTVELCLAEQNRLELCKILADFSCCPFVNSKDSY